MAKGEGSQRSSDAPIRVYKSKDMRKRPVKRKRAKSQDNSSIQAAGEAAGATSSVSSSDSRVEAAFDPAAQQASASGRIVSIHVDEAAGAIDRDGSAGVIDAQAAAAQAMPVTAGQLDDPAGPVQQGAPDPADSARQDKLDAGPADPAWPDGLESAGAAGIGDSGFVDDAWPDDADDAALAEGSVAPLAEKPKKRFKVKGLLIALGLVVALVVVGLGAFFAWDRWGRYDDHAEMQGQWYVLGSTTPLTIDSQAIHLTDEIAYEYTIDDHAKTIQYTFGPMQGQGRYWFSEDRNFLAITDGEGFTGAGNAFQDIAHMVDDLASSGVVTGTKLPEGDGVIVLSRQPGLLATMAKEAGERAKAQVEQKKAQERAAVEQAAAEKKAADEAKAQQEQEAQNAEQVDEYYYEEDDGAESTDGEQAEGEQADGAEGVDEEATDGEGEQAGEPNTEGEANG